MNSCDNQTCTAIAILCQYKLQMVQWLAYGWSCTVTSALMYLRILFCDYQFTDAASSQESAIFLIANGYMIIYTLVQKG